MRPIGVLMLLTGLAAADPAARIRIPLGPSKVVEVEPWQPPARPTGKYPGITGQDSAAVVLAPGPHGDGRPWPYGILIAPPRTGDDNQIVSGSNGLPGSDLLSAQLARRFDLGVGQVLEWLLTPRFVRRG